jgi:3-hydroxybutyryl-CoA dehydrogenase
MAPPTATDVESATTVLVIGGGTMGAGIAATAVMAGLNVHLVERDEAAAQTARSQVERVLQRETPDAAASPWALSTSASMTDELQPQLVIESVSENVAVKRGVLTEAGDRYPDALLTTNTSSLSIDLLANHVRDPARFLGLHFFNPVPRSKLIEIVHSTQTHADWLVVAEKWASRFGKQSIVVANSPGFATSRLGIAIGLEAMRMVAEGVASCADIDTGMVLGYKFPIGPLELSDMVGLDVRLAIARHLQTELGDRFEPPRILIDKVDAGELGVKTGQGFYEWAGRERLKPRSEGSHAPRSPLWANSHRADSIDHERA